MKSSDKILMNAALVTAGILIYFSNRVAAQFTDEQEARHYRKRQAVLSAGVSAGTALMLRAAAGGIRRRHG